MTTPNDQQDLIRRQIKALELIRDNFLAESLTLSDGRQISIADRIKELEAEASELDEP